MSESSMGHPLLLKNIIIIIIIIIITLSHFSAQMVFYWDSVI